MEKLTGRAEIRRRPLRWAPPFRLGLDPEGEPLRLYTVQTADALEELVRSGLLSGGRAFWEPDFVDAYAWLLEEMSTRLPTEGTGMVWCWARIRRRDLVRQLGLARGQVLLTLEVPRKRALLHPFGDWHSVLNRCLHHPGRPGESIDDWERRTRPASDDFWDRLEAAGCREAPFTAWPPDLYAEATSSWRQLFEATTWDACETVQATLHEIRVEDVVRAIRII